MILYMYLASWRFRAVFPFSRERVLCFRRHMTMCCWCRCSELEESLLVLPFSYVTDLLPLLNTFIQAGWEVELACRCLFFLLRSVLRSPLPQLLTSVCRAISLCSKLRNVYTRAQYVRFLLILG